MVSVSSLQRLEGDQAHTAGGSRASESAVMESILASMRNLLNSRQGCCEIRPDYGLTDFNAAVENYRNAISLVARDVEDYVGQAAALTHDLGRLADLRARLRGRMVQSPLCDGERLADELLTALRGAWREWATDTGA